MNENQKIALEKVVKKHKVKIREFEPGTRAGILKRERMELLSREVKKAREEGRVSTRVVIPHTGEIVDQELIVRGGRPDGKLD